MDRRADRAKTARLVRRILISLLRRGRLGRRHAGDDRATCQLFEVDVPTRKDKLQRHRCKREPSAPPPIGTNPTHWQNAPSPSHRTVYSGAHQGQCLQFENITAAREFGWIVARM
jgi:hypothetical protein